MIILNIIASALGNLLGEESVLASILYLVVFLATIVPFLAVTWRRLHDAGFPGPIGILYITAIGAFVVWILCAMPTNRDKWKQEWADRG